MENNIDNKSRSEMQINNTMNLFETDLYEYNWMEIVFCILGILGSLAIIIADITRNNHPEVSIKHFKIPTGEVFRLDSTDLVRKIYHTGNRSFSMENSTIID